MQFPTRNRKGLANKRAFKPKGDLMGSKQLKSMSTDQLMDLYQKVHLVLAGKLQAEMAKIEERLRRVKSIGGVLTKRVRHPYPPPKYKN